VTREQKLEGLGTLAVLTLFGLAFLLYRAFQFLVYHYQETTIGLLLFLTSWFLGSLIYFLSHPVLRVDPEPPKDMTDGHE
jgi:hypothetical protein